MSRELDNIMYNITTAARTCFNLNTHEELNEKEQTIFYQYAEKIIMIMTHVLDHYDVISAALDNATVELTELSDIWSDTNSSLTELSRSITSPKLRAAVASAAFSIDRTLSLHQNLLNK